MVHKQFTVTLHLIQPTPQTGLWMSPPPDHLPAETTELVRPPSDHVSPPAAEKCIDVHSMVRFVCDNAELQCACMNLVNTPVNVSRCNVQVLEISQQCNIMGGQIKFDRGAENDAITQRCGKGEINRRDIMDQN
ncbi:Hypothetical protein SMAX5B_000248 [Scophthalmus maximus]|uniref:Uncharacterized protein n=1 Tax=Scophthalmus maximus TaxID=52904 RepID=A0A2U9CQA4_SCOMX|nr:Hypothetical protein SMAX5B_000248 [Scophthalmus maximus]